MADGIIERHSGGRPLWPSSPASLTLVSTMRFPVCSDAQMMTNAFIVLNKKKIHCSEANIFVLALIFHNLMMWKSASKKFENL
ncbi:hypothetical protein BLOT_007275 [Blomia tropicalis]|nr:hypothetical protein BLOT_007275 [Blomia tropicalis]